MVVASAAFAQSIDDQQRQLERARISAAGAAARAARLEAQAAASRDEAARARVRAAAVAARIQAAEADIDAAEARIVIIEQLRRAQRARLAVQQGPTVRLMAALQSLARRPAALALVQPGSVGDLVHIRATMAAILPAVHQRTAGLRADVARGRALRKDADRALAALAASRRQLVVQRQALAALAIDQRRAAERFAGGAIAEQDRALALGEEARDITDLIGRLDAAASVSARLATLPGPLLRPARPGEPRSLPVDTAGEERRHAGYRLPVVGRVITGLGEVSATGVRARGLTIATRPSAQVVAPTDGRIAFAGPYRGYGLIVIIDHGGGWTTLITSLAALDVAVGDTVDAGSPIGKAGPSRPTVTIELRHEGRPIDITRLVT